MKEAYPVLMKKYKNNYLVYVPDMEIYTEGKNITDAIEMARDAIGLKGITLEDSDQVIPEPSDYEKAIEKARKEADDIFDYSDGIATIVDVDFAAYRRRNETKTVRRNVTLPAWLDFEAGKAGINVSKVLQNALMDTLDVKAK